MIEIDKNFLLINKPADWTSFDVVSYIRKSAPGGSAKRPKVGHAGTLDPFATGLLIVAVGREATKRIDEFKNLSKTYIATIRLGATSDTDDKTGVITFVIPSGAEGVAEESLKVDAKGFLHSPPHRRVGRNDNPPSRHDIDRAVATFIGTQLQTPPMYSAKKVAGVRLYKLARQGKTVERAPSQIEIYNIEVIRYAWPLLELKIHCSPGTYIRTIAHDLGEKLGVGAYCEELVRTAIGPYTLENAQNIA
ncbi:MAG: tRNA pseudouridine(55) synthase TruB [bacterium]|nr:tRNA pseudouridine(55) synthase TruB [bacterium]